MNTLFGRQETIANEIRDAISSDNFYLSHAAYISGEMGVGKTYITSKIITDLQTDDNFTIIIAPKQVSQKWQKVLIDFGAKNVQIYNRKNAIDPKGILILQPRDLTPAYLELSNSQIQLVVYDEIHTLKPNTKPFENLTGIRPPANMTWGEKTKPMFLGLTGTIFGQNQENLNQILAYTHPNISPLYSTLDLSVFMMYWSQVAWTISLSDVESHFSSDNSDDIVQEIAPIVPIIPTAEQKLVYEIARLQLTESHFTNVEQSAIQLLDLPETKTVKSRHLKTNRFQTQAHKNVDFSLSYAVNDIDFKKTPKYQKLLEILDKPEKTLVFVNDTKLIAKLAATLTEDGVHVATLPKSKKPHEYSQFINDALSTNTDVFIIEPMKISVGVDINTASRIVWYQILSDLNSTIQAQRRVYRLSSTKSSTIHYLAYANTYQEKLIKEISESSKKNALSYGSNDDSNLAKLSGLLFDFN